MSDLLYCLGWQFSEWTNPDMVYCPSGNNVALKFDAGKWTTVGFDPSHSPCL